MNTRYFQKKDGFPFSITTDNPIYKKKDYKPVIQEIDIAVCDKEGKPVYEEKTVEYKDIDGTNKEKTDKVLVTEKGTTELHISCELVDDDVIEISKDEYDKLKDEQNNQKIEKSNAIIAEKKRIFVESIKSGNFDAVAELLFGKETIQEKITDKKEAQEIIYNKKYFVNITTENDRKVAVVHDASTADQNVEIEYDPERGDKFFDTIDEAKKYAESFA